MLKTIRTAFLGPPQARAAHRQALKADPGIENGIRWLEQASPASIPVNDDAPVFLLAAGWRSGSTLLQRLIMSDPEVLIWGEPYDECGMIQRLAETVQAFRPDWPPQDYFYDGSRPDSLTGEWIANLFPPIDALRKAHRAFFDTQFAEPARRAGAKRWGIKEVRLTSAHCSYLRWLYPKAQFVFLYRNPFDAYLSYCRYGRSWYDTFPDKPVFTASYFGRHWKTLAKGFLDDASRLGALVIPYEDLVAGHIPLTRLEQHLEITVDHQVLTEKVGGSKHRDETTRLNTLEHWLLKRAVSPVAQQLGYNC